MAKKKTDGRPAVNPQIVREIIDFTPGDYLPKDERAEYNDVVRQMAEIEKEREAAVQGMKKGSADYFTAWCAVRSDEYRTLRQLENRYDELAIVFFGKTYYKYWPSVERAGEIIAEQTIKTHRDMLEKRMQTRGQTLDDARQVDADNMARGIAGNTIIETVLNDRENGIPLSEISSCVDTFTLFSDETLKDVISENLPHVIETLNRAQSYLSERAGVSANDYLAELYANVLPQKWTLVPNELTHMHLPYTGAGAEPKQKRAHQMSLNLTATRRELLTLKPYGEAGLVPVGRVGKREEYVLITAWPDEEQTLSKPLDRFALFVLDIIFSIWREHGNNAVFTPGTIYATPFPGRDPGKAMTARIIEAVEAIRTTDIIFDASNHVAALGKHDNRDYSQLISRFDRHRKTYLCPIEEETVTQIGGRQHGQTVSTAWRLLGDKPPLFFQYVETVRRYAVLPNGALNICDDMGTLVRMSPERALIADYIARRIVSKGQDSKIMADTLAAECGLTIGATNTARLMNTFVAECVRHFARIGIIDSYCVTSSISEKRKFIEIASADETGNWTPIKKIRAPGGRERKAKADDDKLKKRLEMIEFHKKK